MFLFFPKKEKEFVLTVAIPRPLIFPIPVKVRKYYVVTRLIKSHLHVSHPLHHNFSLDVFLQANLKTIMFLMIG